MGIEILKARLAAEGTQRPDSKLERWISNYSAALDPPVQPTTKEQIQIIDRTFRALFQRAASTRLFNHIKETLWRMICNGIRSPARLHSGDPCHWCSAPSPDANHILWECPETQTFIQTALGSRLQCPIDCHHLWLVLAPQNTQPYVWNSVALTALHTVEYAFNQNISPENVQDWMRTKPHYTKNHHDCVRFCVPVRGWGLTCVSLPLAPVVIVHMHCITQLSYLKHAAS